MTSSYRDYHLWLRTERRRRWRRALGWCLLLACAGAAGYLLARTLGDYRSLKAAVALLQAGDLKDARTRLLALEEHRWFGSAARDGLGLVALLEGRREEAERRFAETEGRSSRFWPIEYEPLVLESVRRGDYEQAERMARHARARKDSLRLRMYHGMALNGLDQTGPARDAMGGGALRSVFERVRRGDHMLVTSFFPDDRALRIYAKHQEDLLAKERTGRRSYLFDRQGEPLVRISVKSGARLATEDALLAALGEPGGSRGFERYLDGIDRRNRVETTLDRALQSAAYRALGRRLGSLVVLGMDGEILASAARDGRKRQPGREQGAEPELPDPLTTLFPTASIAKLATLLGALESAGTIEAVYPHDCRAPLKLDGKPLYDWRPHGAVGDPDRALAVSCNLSFARLGLKLGPERLIDAFHRFGFSLPADDASRLRPLGVIEGRLDSEREQAQLATGLGLTRSTTVGAAAMALAVATGGEFFEPFFLKRKLTIGGDVYRETAVSSRRITGEDTARALAAAMRRVVEDPEGTGQRARPSLLTLAAKTGTSGGGAGGLDCVMVGFAPAESPRFAFAVHLVGAGRADWECAFATKELLEGIQAVEADRQEHKARAW